MFIDKIKSFLCYLKIVFYDLMLIKFYDRTNYTSYENQIDCETENSREQRSKTIGI